MPAYYPVFLDVRGRRCVVFGGGSIGEEKVARLADYGADVVVVSRSTTQKVRDMADSGLVKWVMRGYAPGDLEGAFIAIVADTSDSRVNGAVHREALARNVPLNVADVTELCTWIAPAIVKRGDVIVAASTGGASPALARKFREELSGSSPHDSQYPVMEYADLAPLLSDTRQELLGRGIRPRPDHWQACLSDDLVEFVQSGKLDQARETLMSRLMIGEECECPEGVCRMWEDLGKPSSEMGPGAPTRDERGQPPP